MILEKRKLGFDKRCKIDLRLLTKVSLKPTPLQASRARDFGRKIMVSSQAIAILKINFDFKLFNENTMAS